MRFVSILLFFYASLFAQFVPNQYIVELKDPAAGRDVSGRARIRAAHAKLSAGLSARGWKTLDRTENVANALIVESNVDGADPRTMMRQFAEIGQVHRVRLFHKSLDRAAQVHNVTAAWQKLGIENAGAGMKIGIIDSGIESSHPGFASASLPALEGFPKVNADKDLAYTNSKVIVARSYASLWSARDPDTSVLDRSGHGTAVAMSAAGAAHDSPIGRLSGMAPAAYIGVYKIFGTPGYNDSTTDGAILRAIDDAVADGMDVINLSFGSLLAPRLDNDILVTALAKAEAAGVIAVVAAGNEGSGFATLTSPGTAPTAITVGANQNSRIFASAVTVNSDGPAAPAKLSSATAGSGSISGALVSITRFDSTGLGCGTFPASSLTGQIALISRGVCTFEVKINNAARAGAKAVVVYTDAARPTDFITMSAGTATLPAVLVTYADGKKLVDLLTNAPSLDITLSLAPTAVGVSPYRLTDFSSQGPVTGVPIKPDLLAVGADVYTAAQSNYSAGDVYSTSGYIVIDGTSFSSPITAGAAAVLKAARPGLRPVDYRSLLINNARPLNEQPQLTVVQTGAGTLNLSAALDAPLRFNPVSISFTKNDNSIEVANLTATDATFNVSIEARQGTAPTLAQNQLNLAANSTAQLGLSLDLGAVTAGVHAGNIVIQADGGPAMRVPYWYGKVSDKASEIQVLYQSSTARSGLVQQDLLFFRVLDANGVSLSARPAVTVVTGSGQVREVQDRDLDIAGSLGLEVILSAGTNAFLIDAGNGVTRRVAITGR